MTSITKKEYIRTVQKRYFKAIKRQKTRILDEFIATLQIHRKSAIRLLAEPIGKLKPSKKKAREYIYPKKLLWIIEEFWKVSGFMCGARLKAALPLWMPYLKKYFPIDELTEEGLRKISPSTIDRRLRKKKERLKKKLYAATKPGLLLRYQIPIRTDNWDVTKPGYLELDLTSHCGLSADGAFAYTLNTVDIFSGWVERRVVLGKGEIGVASALDDIKRAIPFTLLAIDSDNGSEFINYHLIRYCKKNNIGFTRSRPYKKDDQAYIEQKNFTHVRKIFGYYRIDKPEAIQRMNNLYQHELCLFQNFFQPSFKLLKKERIGSKRKRTFDAPKTPCQRLLESPGIPPDTKLKLQSLLASLDPFILQKTINQKIRTIRNIQAGLRPTVTD